MHLVALGQQQLGQVRPVLTGDAGDQRDLSSTGNGCLRIRARSGGRRADWQSLGENSRPRLALGHMGCLASARRTSPGTGAWSARRCGGTSGGAGVHRSGRADLGRAGPARPRRDVRLLRAERPQYVVLAAAKVGGILANATYPTDFLSDNLRIQVNVLDAALAHGVDPAAVPRLLLHLPQARPAADPRGLPAHRARSSRPTTPTPSPRSPGCCRCRPLRRQHGGWFISAMPTNLYGPGDNFDLQTSHVLPAMIRRFHEAKESPTRPVSPCGAAARRAGSSCTSTTSPRLPAPARALRRPRTDQRGNRRRPDHPRARRTVAGIVGYEGERFFDPTKPDGTPRKLLDVRRINDLGFTAQIPLEQGIRSTYEWYLDQRPTQPQEQPVR